MTADSKHFDVVGREIGQAMQLNRLNLTLPSTYNLSRQQTSDHIIAWDEALRNCRKNLQ